MPTTRPPQESLTSASRLDELVALISARVEAGESVDVSALTADCPQFRERLEMLLPTLEAVVELHSRATAGWAPPEGWSSSVDPAHQESSIEHPASSTGILGDFRILREVGRGGMGVVYEAEQISLGRRVALKVLPFAAMLDRQQLARFKNEARAAATLDHPNIVAIHSVGAERSVHYYAMQLIEGQSLAQVIEQLKGDCPDFAQQNWTVPLRPLPTGEDRGEGREQGARTEANVCPPPLHGEGIGEGSRDTVAAASLPTLPAPCSSLPAFASREYFRTIAQLGIQAAEALDHAHQNGILHRDIKPANLLVDDTGKLWITDFGLARMEQDAGMTMTGDLLGTLRYMSPEQALAKRVVVDHRSDIYSLGVTLYELLALQPAFKDDDRQELLRQIAFEEPRQLRHVNSRIPQDLETIILKSIEKNPADRYATSQDLADDLRRFLEDRPIVASPPSFAHRARKWAQRHIGMLMTAAVVLLLAALGTGTAAVYIASANHQARIDKTRAIVSAQKALASAEAEKLAKHAAQAREAETAAVLEFVEEKILAAARPQGQEGGLGQDVTLRKAVEAALPFVVTSFADQPLIEARLRMAVGTSLRYLGDDKTAAEQFQAARALCTQHLGPDHPNTLMSMNSLAVSYHALSRYADALKLFEESLALRKAKLGPDHPETLQSMVNLAVYYNDRGLTAEAAKLQEETLVIAKAKLGPDHPETLNSMNNLAVTYTDIGRHAEALKLLEETLALKQTKLGRDHPDTLTTMSALAVSYVALARYTEALELREETLALAKAKLGSDHPSTMDYVNNLATSYADFGRHVEALKLHEDTLAMQKTKLGADHPNTLKSMNNLAESYMVLGRHADALQLNEQTLARRKSNLGADHPDTLRSMHNLAVNFEGLGRHAEALQLHEETLALMKAKLGPNHPATHVSMYSLAQSYTSVGRHAEAIELGEETLALMRAKLSPDHPHTLLSMMNLAASYDSVGRHADALELGKETLSLVKAKLGPDHPYTLASMNNLASSFHTLGRHDDALPIIDDCLARAAGKTGIHEILTTLLEMRLRIFQTKEDPAGCLETASKWEALKRIDAESLYQSACFRAVCAAVIRETDTTPAGESNATRQADQAMAWLKQAIEAGFADVAHLKVDKDLDTLRDREDFKKLLAELEKDNR